MTSHENTLKEALMGLSKLQLPFENDLSEKEDLSLRFPEKVIELQNRLRELQKSMMANSARVNPNFKK